MLRMLHWWWEEVPAGIYMEYLILQYAHTLNLRWLTPKHRKWWHIVGVVHTHLSQSKNGNCVYFSSGYILAIQSNRIFHLGFIRMYYVLRKKWDQTRRRNQNTDKCNTSQYTCTCTISMKNGILSSSIALFSPSLLGTRPEGHKAANREQRCEL